MKMTFEIARKIKDWLDSNESFFTLDGTAAGPTWQAGGCVLLALGIKEIFPSVELIGLEKYGNLQHVAVTWNNPPSWNDQVFDANGWFYDQEDWSWTWQCYETIFDCQITTHVSKDKWPHLPTHPELELIKKALVQVIGS